MSRCWTWRKCCWRESRASGELGIGGGGARRRPRCSGLRAVAGESQPRRGLAGSFPMIMAWLALAPHRLSPCAIVVGARDCVGGAIIGNPLSTIATSPRLLPAPWGMPVSSCRPVPAASSFVRLHTPRRAGLATGAGPVGLGGPRAVGAIVGRRPGQPAPIAPTVGSSSTASEPARAPVPLATLRAVRSAWSAG